MKINLLLFFLILLSITGTTSAYQLSQGESPASARVVSGQQVTHKAVIDFPPRGSAGTFPQDHHLVISTRLENPQWTWSLVLDGMRSPNKTVTTEHLILNGSELNHPADVSQSLVVIVTGTAPDVSRITMTSIMDISETDSSGTIDPNASRSDSQIPVHPRGEATPAGEGIPVTPAPAQVPALQIPDLTLLPTSRLQDIFSNVRVTITPDREIIAGTPVTVTVRKHFTGYEAWTFPPDHDLLFSTDLANPQWTYSILLDGNENPRIPRPGRALGVTGFELSYPRETYEDLIVTVEGTAPRVSAAAPGTVLQISEMDKSGDVIPGSILVKTAIILPSTG